MKLTGLILLAASVALVVSGCKPHSQNIDHASPAPAVTVAPVIERELAEHEIFTGRLEPIDSVEIRPRVSGYLQEVRFQAGQRVREGTVSYTHLRAHETP